MTTSPKTMIMIANMKNAAIEDTAFSTAVTARSNPSSMPISPAATDLIDRNSRDHRVEFLERIAAALAARIECFRPGLVDTLQQVPELLGLQRLEAHPGGLQFLLGRLIGLLQFLTHRR